MGFVSFIKHLFSSEDKEEMELDKARARHGIVLDAKDRIDMNKATSDEDRMAQEYDAWEDLKNIRSSFFIGGWAAKKFHVIGEDKVKKQLEDLEKKKETETEAKSKKWDKWGKN
jgi:hypothetical protein